MKNPSNKNQITKAELARLANLTVRRINQLCMEGRLPKSKGSILPREEAIAGLFAHFQRVPLEMQTERLALTTARRKIQEHELDQTQGQFIRRDEAWGICTEALRKLMGFCASEFENQAPMRRQEKLKELGAPLETIAAFREWDATNEQARIARIHASCKAESVSLDALKL